MFFRRSPLAEVEPAHRALSEGRYEVAFALLENAARRGRRGHDAGLLKLLLAAVYALYEEDGLEGGLHALQEALEAEPTLVEHPLYRALRWEFAAYSGSSGDGGGSNSNAPATLRADIKKGAVAVAGAGDAVAAFHAARALLTVGASGRAIKILEGIPKASLPRYLVWRCWSLLGRALEGRSDFEGAREAFANAVATSCGADREGERLSLASSLIETDHAAESLEVLAEVKGDTLEPDERAVLHYLTGRAHTLLDNPNRALEHFLQASVLEAAAGEPSFSLHLALAQTYALLGRLERAAPHYLEAISLAGASQRAFARHEYAFSLFEADHLLEAREVLLEIVEDKRYAFLGEAKADLAETEYRLGNFGAADAWARGALEAGAVAPACICLGNIANDYYRLEEAVDWFEKAVSASKEGEPDWLTAHEMLADVLAQTGEEPARVISHAEAALKHLHPADEWALTLRGHVHAARERLGGHPRLLN